MPSAKPHAGDRLRHYLNSLSSLKRNFLQRANLACLTYTAQMWCLKAIFGLDTKLFLSKPNTQTNKFPFRTPVLRSILVQISYLGGFKGEGNNIIYLMGQSGAAQVVSLPEVSIESSWPGPLTFQDRTLMPLWTQSRSRSSPLTSSLRHFWVAFEYIGNLNSASCSGFIRYFLEFEINVKS